jgi:hypothetical protein
MNEKSKQKHKLETTNDCFKLMFQIETMIVLQQVLVCETYLEYLCSTIVAFKNKKEKMANTASKSLLKTQNLKTMWHVTK